MKNGEFKHILERFDRLESKIDDLRTKELPNMKTEIAILKEKAQRTTKIIAGVGGLVTVAVSTAIAYFKRS